MNNLFRLSTTEAGLEIGYLYSYGIPAPLCNYSDYSARFPNGHGGQSLAGFSNVPLQWLNVTPRQVYWIERFVTDALAGDGVLYATVYRKSRGLPQWIDVSGVPHYPETVPNQANATFNHHVFTSCTLYLNDVTIINEVSTVLD